MSTSVTYPGCRAVFHLGPVSIILLLCGSALGISLDRGAVVYKQHPMVPTEPKYETGRPAYLIPENIVATLNAPHEGDLAGVTTSTAYLDPATGRLAFEYVTQASPSNARLIISASLDGNWAPVTIYNVGADASGNSGGAEVSPEWADGDPLYIARTEYAPYAPNWTFRTLLPPAGTIGTSIGPGEVSSRIWFETNAGSVSSAFIGYLDSGRTGRAAILAPSSVPDRDADGILDADDNCPFKPNPNQDDADADDVGDACDFCAQTPPGVVVNARGCPVTPGDFDRDADVDFDDYSLFLQCITGPDLGPVRLGCEFADFDSDGDVDQVDFGVFQACVSGSGVPARADCAE